MKLTRFSSPALRLGVIAMVIAIGLFFWTKVMARWGHDTPPAYLPAEQQADLVVVNKAARKLSLLREGVVIREYSVSLGRGADDGAKQREGDMKTPEGHYNVDWRNARSRFSLSLHVSWPDADDIQRAKSAGYSPGHNIMIHGLPNGWGWLAPLFRRMDWTDGCIAVTNSEMREIWARTPTGTPVIIEK
ncbi:L,D-transpeptidase family protein [Mangrovibacter phragmitis]|uniref:L,D-transpeptidase family protein n=1 Tax=Mangrovibacter phragmitis TaxID=1691903 RepID=UPI00336AB389